MPEIARKLLPSPCVAGLFSSDAVPEKGDKEIPHPRVSRSQETG